MARYHRRRRKYGDKFTPAQKQKYWDEKVLAEPDKLPQNFDYYVPKVPTMKDGPSLEDVGLTNDIHEVVVFYRDEKAKPPESFDPKVGENLIRLIFTAGTTATALFVIVAAGSSSRRSNLILELLALGVGAYGGSYSLWLFGF